MLHSALASERVAANRPPIFSHSPGELSVTWLPMFGLLVCAWRLRCTQHHPLFVCVDVPARPGDDASTPKLPGAFGVALGIPCGERLGAAFGATRGATPPEVGTGVLVDAGTEGALCVGPLEDARATVSVTLASGASSLPAAGCCAMTVPGDCVASASCVRASVRRAAASVFCAASSGKSTRFGTRTSEPSETITLTAVPTAALRLEGGS